MTVQYAESDGASIAYEILSDSGPDLILLPPVGNRAVARGIPIFERYYEGLGRFSRLIVYDRRGVGMSSGRGGAPTLAEHVADLEAVRRAAGAERPAVTTVQAGALIALAHALRHPERAGSLVLINAVACDAAAPTGAVGDPPLVPWEALDALSGATFDAFARGYLAQVMPGADAAELAQQAQYYKASVTPRSLGEQFRFARGLDLRDRLAEIDVPTLLMHTTRDRFGALAHGRFMAARMPNARLLEIDSDAYFPWLDADALETMLRGYEEFLVGRVGETAARMLATVMFNDIVDSTAQQRARGDAAWRLVRRGFELETRRRVEQHGGRVVHFLGDGVLAVFALPSEALRAAERLAESAHEMGLEIRAGLHAGEVDRHDDGVSGICVTIAARVAEHAQGGEVLLTETVRDLVAGGPFRFTDAGTHELKGVGPRALLRLARA